MGATDHDDTVARALEARRAEIAALVGPGRVRAFQRDAVLSLRHGYLFCQTPKAACSTIKLTLQRAEIGCARHAPAENREIHVDALSPLLKPMMVPRLREVLGGLYAFCFVRDPAERLVSAYLDKIVRGKPQKARIAAALGLAPDAPIGFAAFVDAVCGGDPRARDPHWSLQCEQVHADRIAYDFVGRFERFAEDFGTVLDALGIDPVFVGTALTHRTGAAARKSDLLTPAIRRRIEAAYARDYDRFGY